jgi:hypothetical protein
MMMMMIMRLPHSCFLYIHLHCPFFCPTL